MNEHLGFQEVGVIKDGGMRKINYYIALIIMLKNECVQNSKAKVLKSSHSFFEYLESIPISRNVLEGKHII